MLMGLRVFQKWDRESRDAQIYGPFCVCVCGALDLGFPVFHKAQVVKVGEGGTQVGGGSHGLEK